MSTELYGVKGVSHLFPARLKKGAAEVIPFSYKRKDNLLHEYRAIRDGGQIFRLQDGNYVKLLVGNQLVMSDTGMERLSNKYFIDHANGDVLIAGLGIGLILQPILEKSTIQSVTIVEKEKDVIDLVAPKFVHDKLSIIHADIFEWQAGNGKKWDTIYFDIWPDICTDNLEEIKLLHNRFKSKLNRSNPNAWMDSWMKQYLQKLKRQS